MTTHDHGPKVLFQVVNKQDGGLGGEATIMLGGAALGYVGHPEASLFKLRIMYIMLN